MFEFPFSFKGLNTNTKTERIENSQQSSNRFHSFRELSLAAQTQRLGAMRSGCIPRLGLSPAGFSAEKQFKLQSILYDSLEPVTEWLSRVLRNWFECEMFSYQFKLPDRRHVFFNALSEN